MFAALFLLLASAVLQTPVRSSRVWCTEMETFAKNFFMGLGLLPPGHAFNQLCSSARLLLLRRFRQCWARAGMQRSRQHGNNMWRRFFDCGDNADAFRATCILFWNDGRLTFQPMRVRSCLNWLLFFWSDRFCHEHVKLSQRNPSVLIHPVKGDRDVALHLCPGHLGQVLGVEDEEVCWPLGAWSCHDSQQHSWRAQHEVLLG